MHERYVASKFYFPLHGERTLLKGSSASQGKNHTAEFVPVAVGQGGWCVIVEVAIKLFGSLPSLKADGITRRKEAASIARFGEALIARWASV